MKLYIKYRERRVKMFPFIETVCLYINRKIFRGLGLSTVCLTLSL